MTSIPLKPKNTVDLTKLFEEGEEEKKLKSILSKRMYKMQHMEIDRQRKIFISNLTGFQSFMNLFMGTYNGFSIDYTVYPEDLKQYKYDYEISIISQGKPGSAEYKKAVESLKKKYWRR